MPPIIARLFGGLGNQMFQYATGRAVALRSGTELVLDSRDSDARGRHWAYALNHFNIQARQGHHSELPPARKQPIRYALWRYAGLAPLLIREDGLGVNKNVFCAKEGSYLHGYFQSQAYFDDYADEIRDELQIVTPPSRQNSEWLQQIRSTCSVSLHVRRGDYLVSGGAYAACDAAYYDRAVALIAERLTATPEIFVFSDDPEWAGANINLPYKMHVSAHNDGSKHYEDMRLIAACQHNITANSTFSWWGSWLNANPQKIIVAPENWFANSRLSNPDLIPNSWHRV